MKTIKSVALIIFFISLIFSCSSEDNDNINEATIEFESDNINFIIDSNLNQNDINALLFMLEEEKLARDTYKFLFNTWNQNIFSNISNSEQNHMDAIVTLLNANDVNYLILPEGQFDNHEIQMLYNQFKVEGITSNANALKIGATIEDLDIFDLDSYISTATSNSVIEVFQNLQCGSRNHLRSFYSRLQNFATTYNPQFITQEEFNEIINNSNEQCN